MQSLEYLLDSGGLQNRFSQEEKREDGGGKTGVRELIATLTGKGPAASAERL